MPRSFAPLRHRAFRLLAIGQLTSNVGDLFYAVALPWYVLSHHGNALLLGAVLACYGLARTAALLIGGWLADRLRPWTVMLVTDAARAAMMVALVVAVATRPPSLGLLAPIAVLLGFASGLFMPGALAIVPTLLPEEDLQSGIALSSGWTQLAILVGPAIGGVVVAAIGPAPAFAVDGATFVISALTLLGVRAAVQERPASVRGAAVAASGPGIVDDGLTAPVPAVLRDEFAVPSSSAPDTRTLWQLIRSERVLPLIFAITLVANLTSGGESEVALPALAHGPFHAGASGFGALVAAIGAGALCGTLLAAQAPRFRRPAVTGSCGFIAQSAFTALVPYLGGTVQAAVALAVFGALNGFSNTLTITAFQRWAPPPMLGRLTGFLMLGSTGIFPVSVLVGGAVVHALGPAVFFPVSGGVVAGTVLVALCFRDWREFGATAPAGARVATVASGTAGPSDCPEPVDPAEPLAD